MSKILSLNSFVSSVIRFDAFALNLGAFSSPPDLDYVDYGQVRYLVRALLNSS